MTLKPYQISLQKEYLDQQNLEFTEDNIESNGLVYEDMRLIAELPECYLIEYTANDTPAQLKFLDIVFKDGRGMQGIEL